MINAINAGAAGPRAAPERGPSASDWQSKEQFSDVVSRLQATPEHGDRASLSSVDGWAVFAESVTAPAAEAGTPADGRVNVAAAPSSPAVERTSAASSASTPAGMRVPPPAAREGALDVHVKRTDALPANMPARSSHRQTAVPLSAGVDTHRSAERVGNEPAALSSVRAQVRASERRAVSAVAHRADSGRVDVAVRLFEPTAEETDRLQQRLHDELGRMGLPAYRLWINGTEVVTSVQSEEQNGH